MVTSGKHTQGTLDEFTRKHTVHSTFADFLAAETAVPGNTYRPTLRTKAGGRKTAEITAAVERRVLADAWDDAMTYLGHTNRLAYRG